MTLATLSTLPGAVAQAAGEDGSVTPGVLGFTVVALLGGATYLLIRSMSRQIKRIDLPQQDASPEDASPEDASPEDASPDEMPPADPLSGGPDRP